MILAPGLFRWLLIWTIAKKHLFSTADLPTLQASPSDPNNPGSADFASRLRRMLEQRK
jgi:hypothetical protein